MAPVGWKPLKPGGFTGHPGGLAVRPGTNLGAARRNRSAEAVSPWSGPAFPNSCPRHRISYNKLGQSASGIANDYTGGKFGPFTNQLFVGDQTWSLVMRVCLEQSERRVPGRMLPLPGRICLRVPESGNGAGRLPLRRRDRPRLGRPGRTTLRAATTALERKDPFEIHEMHVRPDGFELTFTEPVDPATAGNAGSYQFENYTYIYQASYGSPEVDRATPPIESATVGSDGRSVQLKVKLTPGHVHELKLPGVRSRSWNPSCIP